MVRRLFDWLVGSKGCSLWVLRLRALGVFCSLVGSPRAGLCGTEDCFDRNPSKSLEISPGSRE
eukprot:1348782-Amorphochlora_amoeboformis.AAC.1